jgi:hypothetical protein
MDTISPKKEKDIITGQRRQVKKRVDRWGDYLEQGEWVGTFRSWNVIYDDDESKSAAGVGRDGIIEFNQLANGNLEAHIEWNHAIDTKPYSADYIITLDAFNRTFTGLGYIDGTEEVSIINGYYEPKKGVLNFTDIGPSHGTLAGGTFIRNWVFINIEQQVIGE